MFVLLILLPFITYSSVCSDELVVTEAVTDVQTEITEGETSDIRTEAGEEQTEAANAFTSDETTSSLLDDGHVSENGTVAQEETASAQLAQSATPRQAVRPQKLARRKPRRSKRFRPGYGPRYRDPHGGYNPVNAYNPYYRAPQTYYDVYGYNPYQPYYPEYNQQGYYPAYPYPQQPYPQPYPHPPPPPVIPTPPPTLAPIPDLYYVQNTDGHYHYRRISVTRKPSESRWSQYSGHYDTYDRRASSDHRYPRRPGRPAGHSEFRPQPRLTSAPYQAQVFGVMSPPPPTQPATETSAG